MLLEAYDPLNYANRARSVVGALLAREASALPPAEPFDGSGVYAVYYVGGLACYSAIASPRLSVPIYVGKAIPAGGRKGGGEAEVEGDSALFRRLVEHARSIETAENLRLDEFRCRYLVVVPVWISLAERFLIDHFRPVWNTFLDGFGNHDPGKGHKDMRRPRWDILHPGRVWAGRLEAEESADHLAAEVVRRLAGGG
jgi:hypothetical protein